MVIYFKNVSVAGHRVYLSQIWSGWEVPSMQRQQSRQWVSLLEMILINAGLTLNIFKAREFICLLNHNWGESVWLQIRRTSAGWIESS